MAVQKTLSRTANKLTFQFDQKASFKLDGKKIDLAKATDTLTFVGKDGIEKTVRGFQGKDGLFYALRKDKTGTGYHINVYGEPADLGKQQFSVRGGDVSKARFDGVRYFKNDVSAGDFTISKGLTSKIDDFATAFGLSPFNPSRSLSVGGGASPSNTRPKKEDQEEILKDIAEAKAAADRRQSVRGPAPKPLDLAEVNRIEARSRPRSMSVGSLQRPPGAAGPSSSSLLQGSRAAINADGFDGSSSTVSKQGPEGRDGSIRTTSENLSVETGDTPPRLPDTILTDLRLQAKPTLSGEKNLLAALIGSVGDGSPTDAAAADAEGKVLKDKLSDLLKDPDRVKDITRQLAGGENPEVFQRLGQRLDPSVTVGTSASGLAPGDIEKLAEDGLLQLAAMAHNRSVVTIDGNSARIFSPDGTYTEFSPENPLSAFNEKFGGLDFPIVLTKSGTDWQAVGRASMSLSDD